MKKLYTTQKFKSYNKKRSKNRSIRNQKFKNTKRKKAQLLLNKSKEDRRLFKIRKEYNIVSTPKYFSFIKRPEETILFINRIEELYLAKKNVFINMQDIEYLDYSSVTILVSVMFSFKTRNIKFNGNFPNKPELAKLLIDSDFFKYLDKPIRDKLDYTIGKENQIFTRANKEVNSELGMLVMIEATNTIWGTNRACKGLQRTLLELMQNTNNHAGILKKGEKHWWLSVNHDKINKKVSFIFIDYGIGIFESLKHKPNANKWFGWFEKIKNKLLHGGNDEILRLLLHGDMHMTVTGQHFRGKGLPGIREVLKRNQISNLQIISNNVYANVSDDKYRKLGSEFSGTFVSWELNESNINTQWIQ